uniref:Uncharacterized protein n=1 Tax=Rhizophora mucronata TaxID=61149 RepID=A0A2P2QI74_RHIMU
MLMRGAVNILAEPRFKLMSSIRINSYPVLPFYM